MASMVSAFDSAKAPNKNLENHIPNPIAKTAETPEAFKKSRDKNRRHSPWVAPRTFRILISFPFVLFCRQSLHKTPTQIVPLKRFKTANSCKETKYQTLHFASDCIEDLLPDLVNFDVKGRSENKFFPKPRNRGEISCWVSTIQFVSSKHILPS